MDASRPQFEDIYPPGGHKVDPALEKDIQNDLLLCALPQSGYTTTIDAFVIFVRRICAEIPVDEMNQPPRAAAREQNVVIRYALQRSTTVTNDVADRQKQHIIGAIRARSMDSHAYATYLDKDQFMEEFWKWPEFTIFPPRELYRPANSREWRMVDTEPQLQRNMLRLDCTDDSVNAFGNVGAFIDSLCHRVKGNDGSERYRMSMYGLECLCVSYLPSMSDPWPHAALVNLDMATLDLSADQTPTEDDSISYPFVLTASWRLKTGDIRTYATTGNPLCLHNDQRSDWSVGNPQSPDEAYLLLYCMREDSKASRSFFGEHVEPPDFPEDMLGDELFTHTRLTKFEEELGLAPDVLSTTPALESHRDAPTEDS